MDPENIATLPVDVTSDKPVLSTEESSWIAEARQNIAPLLQSIVNGGRLGAAEATRLLNALFFKACIFSSSTYGGREYSPRQAPRQLELWSRRCKVPYAASGCSGHHCILPLLLAIKVLQMSPLNWSEREPK